MFFDETKNHWNEFPSLLPAPSASIAGQKVAETFVVWSHYEKELESTFLFDMKSFNSIGEPCPCDEGDLVPWFPVTHRDAIW